MAFFFFFTTERAFGGFKGAHVFDKLCFCLPQSTVLMTISNTRPPFLSSLCPSFLSWFCLLVAFQPGRGVQAPATSLKAWLQPWQENKKLRGRKKEMVKNGGGVVGPRALTESSCGKSRRGKTLMKTDLSRAAAHVELARAPPPLHIPPSLTVSCCRLLLLHPRTEMFANIANVITSNL